MADLTSALEAILFASGESMPVARLSLVLGAEEEEILRCASELAEQYEKEERGIRLLHLGEKLQMCSAPEYAPYITKALEQRKPPAVPPADTVLVALGQAIGLALDKAILYGTGSRMPLGVVSRLCQTSQPADYPPTARPWIVEAFGAAKGKYSRGEKVFVMNETTYTTLAAQTVSVDASGRIVTAIFDRMPVTGGIIEVLDFVPDNVIIGGYFDLYLLAERSGNKFATSEHVKFLADQTVMKGTARYDGKPAIAEGFVAIGIKNTTPNASMTFAPDDANPDESE